MICFYRCFYRFIKSNNKQVLHISKTFFLAYHSKKVVFFKACNANSKILVFTYLKFLFKCTRFRRKNEMPISLFKNFIYKLMFKNSFEDIRLRTKASKNVLSLKWIKWVGYKKKFNILSLIFLLRKLLISRNCYVLECLLVIHFLKEFMFFSNSIKFP